MTRRGDRAPKDLDGGRKRSRGRPDRCSCRGAGEGWAEALNGAEARCGHRSRDILVTAREIRPDVAADTESQYEIRWDDDHEGWDRNEARGGEIASAGPRHQRR